MLHAPGMFSGKTNNSSSPWRLNGRGDISI